MNNFTDDHHALIITNINFDASGGEKKLIRPFLSLDVIIDSSQTTIFSKGIMTKIGPFTFFCTRHPSVRVYMKIKLGKYQVSNYPRWYKKDYKTFKSQHGNCVDFPIKDYPIFVDRVANAGSYDSYYFVQDLYMAQKIYANKPEKHVDVGSRVDGFVAHVASFMQVELFDIRPIDKYIPNVTFKQADLMDEDSIPADYCDSISSLHALEHFGLGRYGDPIDIEGHLKAFNNITKILKPGGTFYFSVPMGPQRIEFNAHRCFDMPYLIKWVSESYEIISFAYIDDCNTLHQDVDINLQVSNNSFGCKFGCALFELKKRVL